VHGKAVNLVSALDSSSSGERISPSWRDPAGFLLPQITDKMGSNTTSIDKLLHNARRNYGAASK
jgi:hypothetical protein